MWRQNWHKYVWTSLCLFIFLWTSSIVQVFDYLAIDIFLTINLFEDQHTLPKWNILSQSCYCCLFYVLAFQDQHTLPKWNILSQSCYCCYWPFRTSTPSQSELRQNISLWEGVLVLKGQYIEQATITVLRQNISLCEGVLVLKGQYIEQATITAFHRIFHY